MLGGRPAGGYAGTCVDVDNAGGARAGVAHLLERGRRRIATITGPLDMMVGQDRLAGYRDALADAGRPADDSLVETGDFSEDSGQQAMRALLEREPDLDAVFAANDLMAVGAMRALREAGRRVPDDVAVVGFDDSPLSRVTDPPLSTVRQPTDEMGRRMAELLLQLIADGRRRHRRRRGRRGTAAPGPGDRAGGPQLLLTRRQAARSPAGCSSRRSCRAAAWPARLAPMVLADGP